MNERIIGSLVLALFYLASCAVDVFIPVELKQLVGFAFGCAGVVAIVGYYTRD